MFERLKKALGSSSNRMSAEEFKKKGEDGDGIIDVRTPQEFATARVGGAENINLHAPDFRQRIDSLDRSGTYYLYCRTGNRSGTAAGIMRDMGFEKVYNIGGIDSLARAGVEIER